MLNKESPLRLCPGLDDSQTNVEVSNLAAGIPSQLYHFCSSLFCLNSYKADLWLAAPPLILVFKLMDVAEIAL